MAEETKKTEKPVHKTMIEPHPDSIPNLTGWKRPAHAFVLLEVPQRNIIKDGEYSYSKGLLTINAESRAEVMHQVEAYIGKGGRVLDYGNFPKLNDANPRRAEKARIYGQGSGQNPWDTLEHALRVKMSPDSNRQEQILAKDAEINALKAKLAEIEAKKAPAPQARGAVKVEELSK
jgi:hypothetical protein